MITLFLIYVSGELIVKSPMVSKWASLPGIRKKNIYHSRIIIVNIFLRNKSVNQIKAMTWHTKRWDVVRTKWPTMLELIMVPVAWRHWEYCYSSYEGCKSITVKFYPLSPLAPKIFFNVPVSSWFPFIFMGGESRAHMWIVSKVIVNVNWHLTSALTVPLKK